VASQPETLSLQSTRKSYSGAQPRGQKPTEDSVQLRDAYSGSRGSSPRVEKDYGDEDLETDLRGSRTFDDVIVEQEVSETDGVATDAHLSDVRLDQSTSSQKECYEEVQPTEPSPQEVLVETTGSRPEEYAIGRETPDSANVHDHEEPTVQEGEMQFDDTPESDISMGEDWPTLSSATIDCPTSSEPASIDRASQEPPNERQRPARIANRPPQYRDNSFETHFQPVPRRHCRRIQKQKLTGHDDIHVGGCLKLGRGENNKNIIPTGNENARQKQPFRPRTRGRPHFIASFHPDPSKDLLATSRSLENKPRRYLREDKERIKSTTLPYSLVNVKDEESSIKTLPTHQKRSRTAHLQLQSTRTRAWTDRRSAVPRGDEAAEKLISAPPAARRHTRALSADNRLITIATVRDRQAAVSSNKVLPFPWTERCRMSTTAPQKYPYTQNRISSTYNTNIHN